MRWLVAAPGPGFSVFDVYAGWTEALEELGEHVIRWNLDDRLAFYDRAYLLMDEDKRLFRKALNATQAVDAAMNGLAAAMWKTRPQVLLVVSGFFTDYNLLDQARHTGSYVILLCTESPYEDDRQLELAAHVNLTLLNDPTNLERFREVGPAEYVPHAYRPSLHHPGPPVPELACDFGFAGTGYPSRIEFLEAMNLDGLTVRLGGNWGRLDGTDSPLAKYLLNESTDCLDNEDTADLYRSTKVGLNLYRREADHPELEQGWSMGPREVEMAATECFFLRDPRGEGDEVLSMLPTFTGPEDAADKLRHWLAHPEDRELVARAARRRIEDRTFTNHAKQLLRLLDRAPAST